MHNLCSGSCVPAYKQMWVSVSKYRPHHSVTNMHILDKSVFDEEANLFSRLKDNKGCAEVISVTLPLCFIPLLVMHNI